MKRFWMILGAMSLLAGCESTDSPVERIRQQVTGDYPTQMRTFGADEKATYAAAKQALKAMGFHFTHGGPAQGIMNASSDIDAGDKIGTLHQFALKADFQNNLDGKSTDVTVSMTETVADDMNGKLGPGSETPLRDTSLYAVFFRNIELALGPGVKPKA